MEGVVENASNGALNDENEFTLIGMNVIHLYIIIKTRDHFEKRGRNSAR